MSSFLSPTLPSLHPHPQRSFTAAVRLYDKGDYEGAIVMFEDALAEYYRADVECRALCQEPQRFDAHDHLLYRYSLHELISGTSRALVKQQPPAVHLPCIYPAVILRPMQRS